MQKHIIHSSSKPIKSGSNVNVGLIIKIPSILLQAKYGNFVSFFTTKDIILFFKLNFVPGWNKKMQVRKMTNFCHTCIILLVFM